MIGFTIYAYGSGGYVFDRSSWTEGSLLLLKLALMAARDKGTKITSKAPKKAMEKTFEKLKESYFDAICGYGWDFTLWVGGSFNFKYKFRSDASFERTRKELLQVITSQKEKMRDQVLIYFCAAIRNYHIFAISERPSGPFGMNMVINL